MFAFAGLPRRIRIAVFAIIALLAAFVPSASLPSNGKAVILEIDGPVGPALSDYVVRGLTKAREQGAAAVVLQIDTPGGLDASMREIVQAILSSPTPVIGFVAPSGARAASAGTYILLATHLAAMAPATNLGAATPVQLRTLPMPGGNPRQGEKEKAKTGDKSGKEQAAHPTIRDKAVQDAVAYIRGLAQLRGRNVEWAVKAVTEAATLSAVDALDDGVIELVAKDIEDLLNKADGRRVKVTGTETQLRTAGLATVSIRPDWRTEFLSVITSPTVALVLLMVGIYGLIFEFWSPGLAGPGIIGAICLVLALFALNQLPVNYAGLGLIVLGIGFIVAEAFVPAFGVLGIGGIVAFVVGSVMLMKTDVPGFQVSPELIAVIGGVSSALFLTVLVLLRRARSRPVASGPEEMVGLDGEVIEWSGEEGRVRTHGEIWQASAGGTLEPGMPVRVIGRDGLTLIVRPLDES